MTMYKLTLKIPKNPTAIKNFKTTFTLLVTRHIRTIKKIQIIRLVKNSQLKSSIIKKVANFTHKKRKTLAKNALRYSTHTKMLVRQNQKILQMQYFYIFLMIKPNQKFLIKLQKDLNHAFLKSIISLEKILYKVEENRIRTCVDNKNR